MHCVLAQLNVTVTCTEVQRKFYFVGTLNFETLCYISEENSEILVETCQHFRLVFTDFSTRTVGCVTHRIQYMTHILKASAFSRGFLVSIRSTMQINAYTTCTNIRARRIGIVISSVNSSLTTLLDEGARIFNVSSSSMERIW